MSQDELLPKSLISSGDYLALSEAQRDSLFRRIAKVRDLGKSLTDGTRVAESEDHADFVENLELDASLLEEYDVGAMGGFTRWRVHHSWTFETSASRMRKAVGTTLECLLSDSGPDPQGEESEYISWFTKIGKLLSQAVEELSQAESFSAAIGWLVLIDVACLKLLEACYLWQFRGCEAAD